MGWGESVKRKSEKAKGLKGKGVWVQREPVVLSLAARNGEHAAQRRGSGGVHQNRQRRGQGVCMLETCAQDPCQINHHGIYFFDDRTMGLAPVL